MAELFPERVFLGWNVPLIDSVKDWLLADQDLLSETLVVVPTSNSGRRLRLALSAEGGGVLSPHVISPSRLFDVDGVTSRSQQLWAWVKAVQSIQPKDFPNLLPNHPGTALKSFRAAMALARQMHNLRDTLADADKSFHDALACSPEKNRWLELCELETRMFQVLKSWKLRDAVQAKRERSNAPNIPVGVSRIVVACVPDPSLLALNSLQAHMGSNIPITVLIHAPDDESSGFDAWGVPCPLIWNNKTIPFPEWQSRLHLVDSASEAANRAVSLFSELKTDSEAAALALCDISFAPALDRAFNSAGWPLYDPEGQPIMDSGIARLVMCCADLLRNVCSFDAARELVRVPGAEMFLPLKISRKHAAMLMDKLHHKHLPETMDDARYLASGEELKIINSISSRLDEMKSGNISVVIRSWLVAWLKETDEDLARKAELASAEVVDAIEHIELHGDGVSAQEAMEMLTESLGGVKTSSGKGDEVLDMEGWLEVSYDSAPHLILAGMHEGCVPDGAIDDAFVPNSLKKELGLRDAAARCARDAFLLSAALHSRKGNGRVDALVASFNDAGEACKPSRLLMRYEGKELAEVVNHLFAEIQSGDSPVGPWTRDWDLKFPHVVNKYLSNPPRPLSPSAIKDYMACPLRFFLKRIAKMKTYDAEKREMDALDFGNLCHQVLEVFGNDESIRDSLDAEAIADYLSEALNQTIEKIYGKKINLPLMVQVESARERLRVFASKQAHERAAGWRIIATEFKVGGDDAPWQLGGHPISMMIDRIDFNEESKQWRVLDYKTTGKAKSPQEQHLKAWKEVENRPCLGELYPPRRKGSAERRWAEVQLPLYAAFVREHFKTGDLPGVGYVNLPRAVSDVEFHSWSGFDEATLDHALVWAEAAIEAIAAGDYRQAAVFPAGERDWDDFAELAPDGLAKAFNLNPH